MNDQTICYPRPVVVKRLINEYYRLLIDPIDNIIAHPIDNNLFEWVYVLSGLPDTPFNGGIYYGKLCYPYDFPFHAPAIYMTTPSGKFSATEKLGIPGISDVAPEGWWLGNTVSLVLLTLAVFMWDDKSCPFPGYDAASLWLPTDQLKRRQRELAAKSWSFNLNDPLFCAQFPQLVDVFMRSLFLLFKSDTTYEMNSQTIPKTDLSVTRLKKEYKELLRNPIDNIIAHPIEDNYFQWVYVLLGPSDTPFSGGTYFGTLYYPKSYPFSAPAIYMRTPSGKFSTTTKLGIPGISDVYPEMWSCAYTASTILLTLSAFMCDPKCIEFVGKDPDLSLNEPINELQQRQKDLAAKSWSFNLNDSLFQQHVLQFDVNLIMD
ncbi:unnamed protein product [Medioppia subpectinata]|uniref:UBC core domain-containing protein n=1 Tax=Medioppia subpectinata TaxID=1979941 RepID=A0A7R9Q678_9ACAR|nr:unnamed protein product [Medioppia subpectinata]CAG2112986.1 unnamed protein product [Medioppia subpectinata]